MEILTTPVYEFKQSLLKMTVVIRYLKYNLKALISIQQ